jgi:hypothetical protein
MSRLSRPYPSRSRRGILIAGAAMLAIGAGACDDDTEDAVSSDVASAVSEVEDAVASAVTAAGDAAGEVVDDTTETAIRNIATQQGEEQFTDAGYPLDDSGLTCEATVTDDAASVDVSCTGTTADGEDAVLTGQTEDLPAESVVELEGTFTGTVAGAEVFTTDSLGG